MEIEAIDVRAENTEKKAAEWAGKKAAEGFTNFKIYKTERYYLSAGRKDCEIQDTDTRQEYVCVSIKMKK